MTSIRPTAEKASAYAGKFDDALTRLRQAVAQAPEDAEALASLSELLVNSNRLVEALALLARAIQVAPGNAGLQLLLGRVCAQIGRQKEAVAAFRAASQLDTATPEPWYELSIVQELMGDLEGAVSSMNRVLVLDPSTVRHHERMQSLVEIGRGTAFAIVSAVSLASSAEILVADMRITTPKCLVYTNYAALNPELASHHFTNLYMQKDRMLPPVFLCRLPSETELIVPSYDECLALCGNRLLAEQLRPGWKETQIRGAVAACRRNDAIEGPVVLIARYGIRTWGHWLGELLPKIVAVEQRRPGFFRYLLPIVFNDMASATVLQSLSCYGVGSDRIAWLTPETRYRVSELYTVTSVWSSDWMIHPAAARLMRTEAAALPRGVVFPDKVALLRRKAETRRIANLPEVEAFLAADGWTIADIEEMDFPAQRALFQNARRIIAVLGSNLSGLLYARCGVDVLTLAPHDWGDQFFFALMQEREVRLADIRGVSTTKDPAAVPTASFRVEVEDIRQGLLALDAGKSRLEAVARSALDRLRAGLAKAIPGRRAEIQAAMPKAGMIKPSTPHRRTDW